MKYFLGISLLTAILLVDVSEAIAQRKSKKKKEEGTEHISSAAVQKFQYAFGEALRYKMIPDIPNAELFFQECIKLDPSQPAPYYELSNIYHQLNELNLALENAKKAAELDPRNYWYQMLYAETLQKMDKNQEAMRVLERLLEIYPEKHELSMRLGMIHFIEGEYEKGIAILNEVEKKIGPQPEVIEPKKMAYIRMGKIEKAAAELRKLIQANPDELLYYLNLANLYQVNEMHDKAKGVYEEALKKFPDNGKLHLAMADHYHNRGDEKRAFKELKLAFADQHLEIDAKVKILLSYYSLINESPELKEEAFELNQILISVHPDEAKAHTIFGDFLYNERKLEEAKSHFKKAVELDERPFPIWNQLIIIEAELDQYDSVLAVTNKALELFPNQPALYYYKGIAHLQLKDYNAAIEDFQTGRKMVVDNPALLNQFYISLGDAYNEVKKYEESDAAFEAALKIDSNDANTLNNYSYYLSLRGEQLEKAEQMSGRSNQLAPNQSSYLDTYAWIMYQLKKYEKAKVWIEKALNASGSGSAEVLEHAGDIYYQLNEKEKALEFWQKAKKGKGEGSPFLDQKIQDQRLYE